MEEKRQKKQNQFLKLKRKKYFSLFLSFYFSWLTEKRTKEHNSIMFENPAFYKSLANQRFMRLLKIILVTKPNQGKKRKQDQPAQNKCSLWYTGLPIVKFLRQWRNTKLWGVWLLTNLEQNKIIERLW